MRFEHLFFLLRYSPVDYSYPGAKDEFSQDTHLRPATIVFAADVFNGRFSCLPGWYTRGRFATPAYLADGEDHLIRCCSEHVLFLISTFATKIDIVLPGAFCRLHSIGQSLTVLPSFNNGVDLSKIANHSVLHL